MNMKIENTPVAKGETDYSRAYAINTHTVQVINAAIASGSVQPDKIADMIRSVHSAFASTYGVMATAETAFEQLSSSTAIPEAVLTADEVVEAIAIDAPVVDEDEVEQVVEAPKEKPKSLYEDPMDAVTPDLIYCLIDGVGRKMIKRHLRSHHGLEWDAYLALFDLPADYPSVAPNYSKEKAVDAVKLGLGSTVPKTPKAVREAEAAAAEGQPKDEETPATSKRGRNRNREGIKSIRIATISQAA